jgi:hypothetical protein
MRSGQWVLTKFRIIDLLHTYEIEGLAYEYWKTTAWMRALGKGAAFKLQQNDDWPEPVIARKLARLIASYDSRIERVPFSSSLLGFWFLPEDSVTNLNTSKLFIPIYNVYRAPAPSFSAFGRLADRLTNDDFKPNFTIQTLDLEGFRHSHSFLADEFRTLQGCTLDGFLACLWALCNIVMVPPRVVTAMVENEELGRQAFAYETLNLLQRGYLLFGETQQDLLETILARLSDFETPIKDYEANDIEIALEILTLRDEKRDQIGLWSGGRRFVVMPMSGGMLLDLQGVPFILNSLFYKLQYEQTERGLIFEEAFREAIKQKGFSLDRVGKIHGSSGSEREIDASVRIDDELILFECRTIERPLDYEIAVPEHSKLDRSL